MRQVKFSMRWPWGMPVLARAYAFHTWVARGSLLAISRMSKLSGITPGDIGSPL